MKREFIYRISHLIYIHPKTPNAKMLANAKKNAAGIPCGEHVSALEEACVDVVGLRPSLSVDIALGLELALVLSVAGVDVVSAVLEVVL